jgi:hypothetical protein
MAFSDARKEARTPKFDSPRCRWATSEALAENDLPAIMPRILRADGTVAKVKGAIIYRDMVEDDILKNPDLQSWVCKLYEPKAIDLSKSTLDDLLDLAENHELKRRVLKREQVIYRNVDKRTLTRDRQDWFDQLKNEPGIDRHKLLESAKAACRRGDLVHLEFEEGARTYSTVEAINQIRRSATSSSAAISFAPPEFN